MQLATNLKSRLKSVLQSEGPVEAITVCNLEAIEITNEISNSFNGEIGRTSLKLRNPNNRPDEWEYAVLVKFEQLKQSGTPIKELEFYETHKTENEKVFRYMKAIPTSAPCLLCHGEVIAPPIDEKLQALYPQDQAMGYKPGDLRGAFVIKIAL